MVDKYRLDDHTNIPLATLAYSQVRRVPIHLFETVIGKDNHAAESATADDIAALEAIVERQAASVASDNNEIQENMEFHLCLTKATGNRVLLELQQILFELSHSMIAQLFRVPGRHGKSVCQHGAIIQAIKEHDPPEARQLMLAHLRSRYMRPNTPT